MTKPATKSLADLLNELPPSAYGQNRRVVIARRADIEAALASGYGLQTVYRTLREDGALTTDYSSFRRAVRAAGIGGKPPASPAPPQAESYTPPSKTPYVFQRPSGEPRVFEHNPVADRKALL